VPTEVQRELVITVPLPDDKGRRGDGRQKVHRFRSHWRELGRLLREFRAVAERCESDGTLLADRRRIEDAAYGLRWLELAHGLRLGPSRSIAPQFPSGLISEAPDATLPETAADG
jgi:hypothetical protein